MNFKEIIQEYKKRGIHFSSDEIEELKHDNDWIESCDYCESCGTALLHDDELYVESASGQWLCDACAIQHDDGSIELKEATA